MKTLPDTANQAPSAGLSVPPTCNSRPENGSELSKDMCYQHLVDVIGMRATVMTRAQYALGLHSQISTALALVDGGARGFGGDSSPSERPYVAVNGMRRRLEVWVNEGGAAAKGNGQKFIVPQTDLELA